LALDASACAAVSMVVPPGEGAILPQWGFRGWGKL
jgi:hypothetical protein